MILKDASIISKLSTIPDLLKGDLVGNDNIEYIKARNIRISSEVELESDVDGDKSDNLPVDIKNTREPYRSILRHQSIVFSLLLLQQKKVLNDISYCISNNNSPVLFEARI